MNTHNTMALAAGIVIVLIVIALIVGYYVTELIEFWDAKRNPPGPDVGVDIVDCGMVHDCDGCDECGAPMVIDEDETLVLSRQALREAWEGVYADYGSNVVHRYCLNARRDGREACERCERVMVGAS